MSNKPSKIKSEESSSEISPEVATVIKNLP